MPSSSASEALVYDTHTSVEHARFVRDASRRRACGRFTVVLSHWHLDHVAGTEVFGDCEVISSERTAGAARTAQGGDRARRARGPSGHRPADPADAHLLGAPRAAGRRRAVELIHTDIHSDDATMVWLADRRLLLCGDTMEDTVTYVDEPGELRRSPGQPRARLRELGARADPAQSWLSRRDRSRWLLDRSDLRDRGLHPHAAALQDEPSLRERCPSRSDRRLTRGGMDPLLRPLRRGPSPQRGDWSCPVELRRGRVALRSQRGKGACTHPDSAGGSPGRRPRTPRSDRPR